MKFSQADPGDGYAIRAYTENAVVIGERRFQRSLIVQPDRIIDDWPIDAIEQLQQQDFEHLAALGSSVVLLGTGVKQHFPSPLLYRCLPEVGIGIEIMTTAAACRTYNILLSEGRDVAAALIL